MSNVIVWDVETIPDIKGFATANGHGGKSDDDIRAAMGDKFPRVNSWTCATRHARAEARRRRA
jgi:hypothetical protein